MPSSGYGTIAVNSQPVYRGGPATPSPAVKFNLTSVNASYAWGSEPGQATVVYDYAGTPVTTGQLLSFSVAGHTFSGVCVDDKPELSSGGNRRELTFKDYRYFLDFDQVYCSFNKLDDHIVNGQRLKRYVHILPDLNQVTNSTEWTYTNAPAVPFGPGKFFSTLTKIYTNTSLTAAQIINLIMGAATVLDDWSLSFHVDQMNCPVYDIDAMGGKSLKAILTEIGDQQGLVMGLFPNQPFGLCWVRKGTDDTRFPNAFASIIPPVETHPVTGDTQSLTDKRVYGDSLSGNPSNIQILGDRNLYQVHNIPMVADWSPGWEQFYDVILFREDIYQRGVTTAPVTLASTSFPAGTPFKTIGQSPADPEQIVARQLALVQSLEITVAQYAVMRGEVLFSDPPNFADYRKFCGKSRLDVPCVIYIEQILLRAFRFPVATQAGFFSIKNYDGNQVPLDSMEVADKLIARVTHDPVTGTMSWNALQTADGNGYAIVQGYQVGRDQFKTISPDRFDLKTWNNQNQLWEHIEFQIDDSGEPDGKYIIFDSPVISSASLVQITDGLGHFNARPTKASGQPGFDIPAVQIACCFQAERYHYQAGYSGKTETFNIGGLNREVAFTYGSNPAYQEIPYADGTLADEKAVTYIAPLNLLQYIYSLGSYEHVLVPNAEGFFDTAIQLNPYLDRVSVAVSTQRVAEVIEYTSERPRANYTPERDMDRNTKLLTLLPGQAQLRNEINVSKILASTLQINPQALKSLSEAFDSQFGSSDPTFETPVLSPSAPTTAKVTLPVGTPLWSKPTVAPSSNTGNSSNTVAVPPSETTAQHSVFEGATTRGGEVTGQGQVVITQKTGVILAQVQGPVVAGAPVGQVAGQPYLSPDASENFVGQAQQNIPTATTHLIQVETGTSEPQASSFPFEVIKVTETTVMISPQSALLAGLNITDAVPIFGLEKPFTVTDGALIYLEVLFDINNNPLFANIATAGPKQIPPAGGDAIPTRIGWRLGQTYIPASAFPLLVGTVDENNLAKEQNLLSDESDFWVGQQVGTPTAQKNTTIAQAALALFTPANAPARFQQFYAYILIGFCTSSPGASGITLNGAGADTAFTIVQAVNTHLMLQGFCSGGVPSQLPVPYSAPYILPLPEPVIKVTPGNGSATVAVTMPTGYAWATIMGSLDGGPYLEYTEPFVVTGAGNHTVSQYATRVGYFDSNIVTSTFSI
jgi:hypothetical protein